MEDFDLTAPPVPGKKKLDLKEIGRLYFQENKSQKELAELFQVEPSTVCRAVQKLKAQMPVPIASEHRHKLIKYTTNILDYLKQLHKILVTELKWTQDALNRANGIKERVELHPTLYRNIETNIRLIDQTLATHKMVMSVETMNVFIDEVLGAIKRTSPSLQLQILRSLQDKGPLFEAMAGAAEFGGGSQRGLFG